jgi:hypothetical protein
MSFEFDRSADREATQAGRPSLQVSLGLCVSVVKGRLDSGIADGLREPAHVRQALLRAPE